MRHKRVYIREYSTPRIRVYFLGDVHEGAANSETELLKEAVRIIAEDKDGYWIGIGDMVDCINYHDRRFNVREVSGNYRITDLDDLPRAQADTLINILEPIKDKCLGMLTGNHEDTVRQYSGFDVMSYMCGRLGCSYLGKKAYVSVGVITNENRGRPNFMIDICVGHGSGGGGKTAGSAINKCLDYMQWETADVNVIGHLHSMSVKSTLRNYLRGDTLAKSKVFYGVNGSFLMKSTMHSDAYFEDGIGMETVPGMLVASFTAGNSKDKCSLRLEPIELM